MKATILLFVSIAFSGCNFFILDSWGEDIRYDIPEIGLSSITEVMNWVYHNVEHVRDIDAHGVKEYYQSPGETYDAREGDCEDVAILAMYLLRHEIQTDSTIMFGFGDGRAHAWVAVGNDWYDPMMINPDLDEVDMMEKYTKIVEWSYGDIIWRSEHWHRSEG